MRYNRISRRHFLQGAAGSFLALPFLPSLMPKADAATLPSPKFFVNFWNGHGGVNLQNMYPIVSNPSVQSQLTTQTMYSTNTHTMRSGALSSLLTTRNSNLPYLGTNLDNAVTDQNGTAPSASAYGVNPNGADFDNGAARVSPIIGSFMSPTLLNKMNLIAGLDLMYYSGHTWATTGNFCNSSGASPTTATNPNTGMANYWIPTIDMVAANYPGFYGNSSPAVKSALLNLYYQSAEDSSNFMSASGFGSASTPNPNYFFTLGPVFSALFGGLTSSTTTPAAAAAAGKKNFILNKVYQDYTRVTKGAYGPGRAIGKNDRNIFEEYMANIASLLNTITATNVCVVPSISPTDGSMVTSTSSGAGPALPTLEAAMQLYNKLITAAFACGATQCFVYPLPCLIDAYYPSGSATPTFSDGVAATDTHGAVFHQHNTVDRQTRIVNGHRHTFQYGFYNLMQQLDAVSNPTTGGTMLDQSLLYWSSECGYNTHTQYSLPVITAGGAGGAINTGQFIDYRNPNIGVTTFAGAGNLAPRMGVPYNRFLGTILQALGIPPSAYEIQASFFAGTTGRIPVSSNGKTVPGYGHPYQNAYSISTGANNVYPYDYQLNDMSVPLPGFYKG